MSVDYGADGLVSLGHGECGYHRSATTGSFLSGCLLLGQVIRLKVPRGWGVCVGGGGVGGGVWMIWNGDNHSKN